MKYWVINKNQYEKMLCHIGSGDLQNADIIVFGNEGGAGGKPLYAIIEGIERYAPKGFGENQVTSTLDLNGNWDAGFWDTSAIICEQMAFEIMQENNVKLPDKGFVKGGFLQYCARISLAIEDTKNDIDYWFKPMGQNTEAAHHIKEYIREGLFQPRKGIQTFIMDWRPLPRPNQNWWGEEYSVIDKDRFFLAFNLKSRKEYCDEFTNYSKDALRRKEILKNAILTSRAKVIIGFGEVDTKQNLIKEILDLSLSDFKEITVDGVTVKAFACRKKYEVKNDELNIFLLPFPVAGKGPFKNGEEMNKFYTYIARNIKELLKV